MDAASSHNRELQACVFLSLHVKIAAGPEFERSFWLERPTQVNVGTNAVDFHTADDLPGLEVAADLPNGGLTVHVIDAGVSCDRGYGHVLRTGERGDDGCRPC